ncbi:hypothetical protein CHUAL_013010 [Chamberlinius hualienensis]
MTQITDLSSTSSWVQFFTESGIPQSVAANYAITFVDNRISRQMLLDLNKEILFDMGITVMGDIIAILKHAKVVHAQLTREKVFKGELSMLSVQPARRAVPAVARVSANEDYKPKITTEIKSQEIATPKKLPIKRKLENESTPGKYVKIAKVANQPSVVISKSNTPKILISKQKPSVFARLADRNCTVSNSGDAVESFNSNQATVVIRGSNNTNSHNVSSTVFDRLGPELRSLPEVKSVTIKPNTSTIRSASAKVTPALKRKIVCSSTSVKAAPSKIIRIANPSGITLKLNKGPTKLIPAAGKNMAFMKKVLINVPKSSSAGIFGT